MAKGLFGTVPRKAMDCDMVRVSCESNTGPSKQTPSPARVGDSCGRCKPGNSGDLDAPGKEMDFFLEALARSAAGQHLGASVVRPGLAF